MQNIKGLAMEYSPKGMSPVYGLDPQHFPAITEGLNSIGHVIIKDVFDPEILDCLKSYCDHQFLKQDIAHKHNKISQDTLDLYLANTLGLDPDARNLFFQCFDESGVEKLLRHLVHGDAAVYLMEHNMRRVDPKFPLRQFGLHYDGQMRSYSQYGLTSDREYTMWIPLQDVGQDASRLMLVDRSVTFADMPNDLVRAIQLRPYLDRDESGANLGAKLSTHDSYLIKLLDLLGTKVYAPAMKCGSAVIFDSLTVLHGSFFHSGIIRARCSIDIRFSSDFDKSKVDPSMHVTAYIYRKDGMKGQWSSCSHKKWSPMRLWSRVKDKIKAK